MSVFYTFTFSPDFTEKQYDHIKVFEYTTWRFRKF